MYRTLLQRAIDRGKIPADEEFLRWAVEHVLLPAAGVRAGA